MLLSLLFACTGGPAKVADSGSPPSGDTADTALPEDLNGTPPAEAIALPTFRATNMDEGARSEADLLGHPTVMWFYPAAGTAG